jgi:hypothetical protein
MDSSPNLTLPYIMAAQAQKHVTHNEAVRALDALVQLAVLDKDLATPPGSPADGNRYIVAASPTGAWAGQAGKVAAWQDGTWEFFAPREGWLAWVADEDKLYFHDGAAWGLVTVAAGSGAATWGINATADTTNRLAVKSLASLFDNVGGGHQQKINKAAAGDTASTLYQTAYSGRAEFGLAGDDDFHVKVSPDGSTWHEAMVADRATGAVRLPASAYRMAPQGRLTLTSGTSVLTSDVLAATTIYYAPHAGAVAPFWDGASWRLVSLAELALALDSNSGHAGYHQSGKNFDLFLDYNGGAPRLVSGPAWTSDTARADAITRQNGIWVNDASLLVRFGTASGDTASIGAKLLTYVGTFRAAADGQTEMTLKPSAASGGTDNKLFLWNAYNRIDVRAFCRDSTATWTIAGTPRSLNNSASNRISFVRGLNEDLIEAVIQIGILAPASPAGNNAYVTLGVDSTSAAADETWFAGHGVAGTYLASSCTLITLPGLGLHYVQALEQLSSSGTFTGYGSTNMSFVLKMAM